MKLIVLIFVYITLITPIVGQDGTEKKEEATLKKEESFGTFYQYIMSNHDETISMQVYFYIKPPNTIYYYRNYALVGGVKTVESNKGLALSRSGLQPSKKDKTAESFIPDTEKGIYSKLSSNKKEIEFNLKWNNLKGVTQSTKSKIVSDLIEGANLNIFTVDFPLIKRVLASKSLRFIVGTYYGIFYIEGEFKYLQDEHIDGVLYSKYGARVLGIASLFFDSRQYIWVTKNEEDNYLFRYTNFLPLKPFNKTLIKFQVKKAMLEKEWFSFVEEQNVASTKLGTTKAGE